MQDKEKNFDSDSIQGEDNCLDWNSSIEDDGRVNGPVALIYGDKDFIVTNFKKDFYNGSKSGKICPCRMAILTLCVKDDEGNDVFVRTNLLLHRKLEWKLSSFFRSIGQKQYGEKINPDWNHVVGAVGRAKFEPRKYTGKDGTEKEANNISYFIDKEGKAMKKPDVIVDEMDEDNESI